MLEAISTKELKEFIETQNVRKRGNDVLNVLSAYKDTQNLFFENYVALAKRDLNTMKDSGLDVKEADIGLKFEEITSQMLTDLGLEVDDRIKKDVNTKRDKVDLVVSLEDNQVMIVECKTRKDKAYNKFSAVTRQLKAYYKMMEDQGYTVTKCILIAPEFSDDFVADAELDYDLNLTLVSAESLKEIHQSFRHQSKHKVFPNKLLTHARDVVLSHERVIKAITR